jgi:hypothetical protein
VTLPANNGFARLATDPASNKATNTSKVRLWGVINLRSSWKRNLEAGPAAVVYRH